MDFGLAEALSEERVVDVFEAIRSVSCSKIGKKETADTKEVKYYRTSHHRQQATEQIRH